MKKIILMSSVVALTSAAASSAFAVEQWEGLYIGGSIGSSMSGEVKTTNSSGVGSSSDLESQIGTLDIGYNQQIGVMVLGVEGSFGFGDLDAGSSVSMSGAYDLNVKGGFDFGRFLPYTTVGVSEMNLDFSTVTANYFGYNYGLGLDYLATDNFIVGIEVLARNVDLTNGIGIDQNLSFTNIALKAAYKF